MGRALGEAPEAGLDGVEPSQERDVESAGLPVLEVGARLRVDGGERLVEHHRLMTDGTSAAPVAPMFTFNSMPCFFQMPTSSPR